MNTTFPCLEKWTNRAVGYDVPRFYNKLAKHLSTLPLLWFGAPCHKTKTLDPISWKWKRYRTELQKDALLLCVFTALKLSARHNISTGWCFSALCRCCVSVLRPRGSRPLGRESKPVSLASICAWLNFLWLLFIELFERLGVPWAPMTVKDL